MLTPMTDREIELTVNNIVKACNDITKLNKRGYNFLYLCPGFIAHYDIHGFIAHYKDNDLIGDIIDGLPHAQYNNFHPGEKDYEYQMAKKKCYNLIYEKIKHIANARKIQNMYGGY